MLGATAACGSSARHVTAPSTTSTSTTTTSMTTTTTTTMPPPGAPRSCRASDVAIQSVFPIGSPEGTGPALFVRIFNTSRTPCWLQGVPGVSFHTGGTWTAFTVQRRTSPTTNGPPWTGVFTPDLVAVTTITGVGDGPPADYDALRLTLGNGDHVDFDGVHVSLRGTTVQVTDVEADSQDR